MDYSDPEKTGEKGYIQESQNYTYDDEHARGETLYAGNEFTQKLHRFASKYGVEQRGIERVPDDERTEGHTMGLLNVGTMWFSANMVVSSFALGLLAKEVFYLGFVDAILTCLFFNLLGVMSVCFFSTFGPKFGLRQMVLSRYWFGWWGVKLVAVLNVIACIGWSAVNSIVGAQLINAVNHDVPGWAGILIIAFCTLLVTLFGYKVVHIYEFWSWIPSLIVFFIVLGEFAASGDWRNLPMGHGVSEMGSVLSYGSVIYGFATGWTSYAADYTVYQPSSQKKKKVFFATWMGLIPALLFTEMLGIALATATSINGGKNRYADGYAASKTGGILAAVLFPPLGTFGKFCLVVLALSIIANNCPNIYSVALSMMVIGRWTRLIPRFLWTTIGTGAYLGIAIAAYYHFESVLTEFMDFIGYWLAIYEGISLTDHFFFKRGFSGYDLAIYDVPNKLPPGVAAVFAFCVGIAGMVLGMSQPWYKGPIALTAGAPPYGGDVGFELAFAFAATAYFCARHVELRYFGR